MPYASQMVNVREGVKKNDLGGIFHRASTHPPPPSVENNIKKNSKFFLFHFLGLHAMKHILYHMDNFLLKEKNSFMTGQNKFLARNGEGRAGHNLLMFFIFQTI